MKRRYSDDAPIITGHPWVWVFPQETLAARQDVRAKLDRWFELASRLIGATAPEALAEFAVHETTLRSPVSFSSDSPGPSAGTVEKATWCIQTALTDQLEVLHRVIGQLREAADLWLVPDTNALLRNPALELWQGEDPATIVLIPQVLAELDEHKMHLRRETVRRAAQKLIRQFDEFDRRGDTFTGITVKDTRASPIFPVGIVESPRAGVCRMRRREPGISPVLYGVRSAARRRPRRGAPRASGHLRSVRRLGRLHAAGRAA